MKITYNINVVYNSQRDYEMKEMYISKNTEVYFRYKVYANKVKAYTLTS